MTDIVDADPAAVAVGYLLAHMAVQAALGGEGRVSARNEPPYPHVRVLDIPGSDRDLRWLVAPQLQVETHGDLDGTPGKALLRRVHYTVLQALRDLPERVHVPGQPVVTGVTFTGGGGWVPEPTGQPRYLSRVTLHMHPSPVSG